MPTPIPTPLPTLEPTPDPTPLPIMEPTPLPAPLPTLEPTPFPTPLPTLEPTPLPTPMHAQVLPYKFIQQGVAGPTEFWNVGNAQGRGVDACYLAIMADSRCAKDYFTYVARADRNCGCKGTSAALNVRFDSNGDVYKVREVCPKLVWKDNTRPSDKISNLMDAGSLKAYCGTECPQKLGMKTQWTICMLQDGMGAKGAGYGGAIERADEGGFNCYIIDDCGQR